MSVRRTRSSGSSNYNEVALVQNGRPSTRDMKATIGEVVGHLERQPNVWCWTSMSVPVKNKWAPHSFLFKVSGNSLLYADANGGRNINTTTYHTVKTVVDGIRKAMGLRGVVYYEDVNKNSHEAGVRYGKSKDPTKSGYCAFYSDYIIQND